METAILIILLIIIFNVIIFKISIDIFHEYTHPSSLFLYFWSIQILIGSIFSYNTGLQLYGLIWIMSIFILLFLGSIVTNEIFKKQNKGTINIELTVRSKYSINLIIIYFIIGLLHTIYVLCLYGFSIVDIFHLNDLRSIPAKIITSRYTGIAINDILSSITLVFVYLTPLASGFQYCYSSKNAKFILIILAMLPCFFVLLIENTKAPFVAASILFLIGLYVSHLHTFGKSIRITFKRITICILFFVFFLMILYISMLIRVGRYDSSAISYVSHSFINYSVGHIFAFDNWFSNIDLPPLSLGEKTFWGLFDFLGISNRKTGIYDNFYINGFIHTNVYTYFRSSIEDFGIYITSLLFFSIGMILSILFNIVKRGGGPASVIILASFMFYCFYYIASAWTYMSFTICFICFYFHLKFLYMIPVHKQ